MVESRRGSTFLTHPVHAKFVHQTRGLGSGRFNGTIQNVAEPTLVAMATKFGLGAQIQSPIVLSAPEIFFLGGGDFAK